MTYAAAMLQADLSGNGALHKVGLAKTRAFAQQAKGELVVCLCD